jgi:ribonuclease HI
MDSSFNQVWGDSGAKEPTTNNDMELTAILCGLKQMGEGAKVQVRSDSQYALDCVFNWSRKWKARGWVKSGGPIKNLDVIKQVVAEIERIGSGCVPMWVRGHAGDMFNEAVDKQSVDAARKLNAKLYDSAA